MIAPRSYVLALIAALAAAGCSSSPDDEPRASARASSASPAAEPSATATPDSAFCLDLEAYQVGVVVFRADVSKAAQGEPLDIEGLKQRAAVIEIMGDEMTASAPADIAADFRAVREAIGTSASRLKPGTQVRDVVGPLFGERVNPAFDAVNEYECGAGDG